MWQWWLQARWRTARMGKAQFFRTCGAHCTALVSRSSHEPLGSFFGSGHVSQSPQILRWNFGKSFVCYETQTFHNVNFVLLLLWLYEFRFLPTKVICLLPHIMICQFQYGLLPWHYSRCACGMLVMNPELITGTVFCRSLAWLVSQSLAFWFGRVQTPGVTHRILICHKFTFFICFFSWI